MIDIHQAESEGNRKDFQISLEDLRKALDNEKVVNEDSRSSSVEKQISNISPAASPVASLITPPASKEKELISQKKSAPEVREKSACFEGSRKLFVRLKDGSIYGPVTFSALCRWVVEGRIVPGNEVSNDGDTWTIAENLPALARYWTIGVFDDMKCDSSDPPSGSLDSHLNPNQHYDR